MTIAAREQLVNALILDNPCERDDFLNPALTHTNLIALLLDLVNRGWHMQITAVRCDHSDDSALGEHCHANGWCVDLWPLNSFKRDDYMDANDIRFAQFLVDAAAEPMLHQIGLAGSSITPANLTAAGPTAFKDAGADHIHLGAQ